MAITLTAEDARQSLNAHVAAKGAEIYEKYGPHIGWKELLRILEDRTCVRYPCEIAFDASKLNPGEFAHPFAKGERPEDGFTMCIHPMFMTQPERVPCLVFYQLVLVNYGKFASADDAETVQCKCARNFQGRVLREALRNGGRNRRVQFSLNAGDCHGRKAEIQLRHPRDVRHGV